MEVNAALGLDRNGLEEQVHQHRFAAPDRAVEIEAAGWLGLTAAAAQTVQPARSGRDRGIADERIGERCEPLDHARLRRIRLQPAEGSLGLVSGPHPIARGRLVAGSHGKKV